APSTTSPLSLHDALPIYPVAPVAQPVGSGPRPVEGEEEHVDGGDEERGAPHRPRPADERVPLRAQRGRHQPLRAGDAVARLEPGDRKSTRLNSSHDQISY